MVFFRFYPRFIRGYFFRSTTAYTSISGMVNSVPSSAVL